MKNTFFLFLFLLSINTMNAQDEKTNTSELRGLEGTSKRFYTSIGLGSHSIQDNKFSAVTYSGLRAGLAFGFEKVNINNRWQIGLDFNGGLTLSLIHI